MKDLEFPITYKSFGEDVCQKLKFVVFFDKRGVLLNHVVPSGNTVTAVYYLKTQHLIFDTLVLLPKILNYW